MNTSQLSFHGHIHIIYQEFIDCSLYDLPIQDFLKQIFNILTDVYTHSIKNYFKKRFCVVLKLIFSNSIKIYFKNNNKNDRDNS